MATTSRFVMCWLILGGFFFVEARAADQPKFTDQQLEFFEQQVRPLLVKRCYSCHSADAKSLKGGLRLDSRSLALKGGDTGPAVVPGDVKKGLLVDAINYGELYQMPPKTKLPPKEIATLTKWVKEGAPWPNEKIAAGDSTKTFDLNARKSAHWCWTPPKKHDRPNITQKTWPKQPLDYFVLAKLEGKKLAPNKPADRRTLIRRAYFDLIGLPPTPQEVEAFVNDKSNNPFEKVVDQLLQSPHFGERWARHWMDLVRYAESHGHEFDYPIHHAYQYRDYLIRAFNADVPYNQFVKEHIAGDLIKNPRLNPDLNFNESVIATGFWFLGEATHAPVDVRGDEAGRVDNQIDVMSKTFLALTVACARCHDHKFDAISTKDYYALAGFLQSSRKHEALLDHNGRIAESVKKLRQIHDDASAILVKNATQQLTAATTEKLILAAREVLTGTPKSDDKAVAALKPDVIFEDFEGDDYEGWTVTGTAFGSAPQTQRTIGSYQGDVRAHGRGFVNSHNIREGDSVTRGDNHLGTMTSRRFVIEHKTIKFLVGGGSHKSRTCINLLINNKPVRSQTGFSSNQMRPASFDVADFMGKEAQLQIVDQQKGGWGNIGVDHIVFSNATASLLVKRPVDVVAKEFGVPAGDLRRWVNALGDKESDSVSHPLFLKQALLATDKDFAARLANAKQELAAAATSRKSYAKQNQLVSDLANGADGWLANDNFNIGAASGSLDIQSDAPRMVPVGMAHSGHLSNRLRGALRSPTFPLTKQKVYYRMKGKAVKARLILDSYYMYEFNGLLFSGFQFDLKDGAEKELRWHQNAGDVRRYSGHRGYVQLTDHGDGFAALDELWLSDGGPPPDRANSIAVSIANSKVANVNQLAQAYAKSIAKAVTAWQKKSLVRTDSELIDWALKHGLTRASDDQWQTLKSRYADVSKNIPAPQHVLAITDGTSENEHVFIRGNHKTLGEEAPRQLVSALTNGPSKPIKRGSGRLELAERIVDPSNAVASRVIANRLWHHLFGRGIVASPNNFGVLGQRPTHPKLLDHLALSFINEDQWSIKRFLKRVMLSNTYQMASTPIPASTELDPNNLLLHRMNIKRLQGEVIRDAILSNSGRLDRKLFGPSVPVFVTGFMNGRGRPRGGPLDGAGRRSIYISIRRNFLSPMMLAFDTPIPFNSIGRRNVSNVPSQALILMNDPFVVEQSKVWARKIIQSPDKTATDRINQMYQTSLGRDATAQELADASEFLSIQQSEYKIAADRVLSDERIWADLAHILWNTKPFIYSY
jgi:hypothetical protein